MISLPRLCHIHNLVNERLEKPQYDCTKLDETYDCGCGDDPAETDGSKKDEGEVRGEETSEDEITGEGMIRGG